MEEEAKILYSPLGWHTRVPSALTGLAMDYFTPSLFSKLLPSIRLADAGSAPPGINRCFLAWAIQGAILLDRYPLQSAKRARSAESFLDGMAAATETNVSQSLRLAKKASGADSSTYRQEIVYGGKAARLGVPLYALEEVIPAAMTDFEAALGEVPVDVDPTDFLAIAVFVLLSLHPFHDGNGRFARAFAMLAACAIGRSEEGALIAAITYFDREWFIGHCMQSREYGVDHYLAGMRDAVDKAKQQAVSEWIELADLLARISSERRGQERAAALSFGRFLLNGTVSQDEIRSRLNISSKVSAGILETLAENTLVTKRNSLEVSVVDAMSFIGRKFHSIREVERQV